MKLLLGDHLSEKYDNVQWVAVKKPEKRKVRLKKYLELQQLAKSDPDYNDLYQANLLDNFYANRPASLSDACFYDLLNVITEVTIMKMEQDSKSGFKNQEFLITEYSYDLNKPNE